MVETRPSINVRGLEPDELHAALEIVARSMCDNPLHVRALGNDPDRRLRDVRRLQGALLESVLARGSVLCAEYSDSLAGVAGLAKRKLTPVEAIKLLPTIFGGFSAVVMARLAVWFTGWVRRLPSGQFLHLGPVAVDVSFQGNGIGSAMLRVLCSMADEHGAPVYLETDKPINVRFYRRYGFETLGEARIIGVPNWFMMRQPKA